MLSFERSPPQLIMVDTTVQAPKPFPFMDLPTELRIEVYRMALTRNEPVLLHHPRMSDGWDAQSGSDSDNSTGNRSPNRATQSPLSPPRRRGVGGSAAGGDRLSYSPIHTTRATAVQARHKQLQPFSPPSKEPLVPALLRASKQIYQEARPVLYSDNEFNLQLDGAIHTLSTLHQRSRSLIKHVRLTIPTHHDILEGFADVVRLGLRYCWGLRTLIITLPYMFPEERSISSTTNVYANAFHILRWLPKACVVKLEGNVSEEIRKVVDENCMLAITLDEKAYLRRQHQMPERH